MKIRVPASSANLGPGFDSCGLALSQYLTIEVLEDADEWEISHDLGPEIASDKTNLLVTTALKLAPKLTPKHLKMTSDIPLARGLGSSSSVIVAGIELANRLGNLGLSIRDKVQIATELEGHPDNVAPAFCGGFVVASYLQGDVRFAKHFFPDADIIAFIPNHELLTEKSRQALPETIGFTEAVKASAIANVMISAIVNANLPLAGAMMEKDQWHEKYRTALVPHLADVRKIGHKNGAFGTYLSGAGPTVAVIAEESKSAAIVEQLKAYDPTARVEILHADQEGVQVY
jgi:homoserine kinase